MFFGYLFSTEFVSSQRCNSLREYLLFDIVEEKEKKYLSLFLSD